MDPLSTVLMTTLAATYTAMGRPRLGANLYRQALDSGIFAKNPGESQFSANALLTGRIL